MQQSIFDLIYPKFKIDKPIRLIELFSGYGSQALALKYLKIPFESGLGKEGRSPAFGSVILKIQDKWELEMVDIEELNGQISLF